MSQRPLGRIVRRLDALHGRERVQGRLDRQQWQVVPQEGGAPTCPPALALGQAVGVSLLLLAALIRPAGRPMRRPLLALLAFLVGWRLLTPAVFEAAGWAEWVRGLPIGWSLVASRAQWLFPALLMTLVLVGGGRTRRDLFLAAGDWTAPVRPAALFPVRGLTWMHAAVIFTALQLVALPVVLALTTGADFGKADRVVVHAPGILAGSALNAACEEYVFRAVPLACFIPAVGVRQAVGLTAVLFGLEHWYGQPSGPVGVLITAYGGWWNAKSMVETRGCTWVWVLHTAGDVPIYAFVAMARP
jgi:membrane protease YdiL (CAAX protease family)